MELKNLKYKKENLSLILCLIISLIVVFLIIHIDFYILLFLIIIQLIFIIFTQKQIQGNSVSISKDQFSDIDEIIEDLSFKMKLEKPKSYVIFDPYINAFVMGFKKPYILVLTSGLIEALDKEELKFVIGHELGHIKMNHSRLKSLIVPSDKNIPFLTFIFNFWLRKTEYTADRIGFYFSNNLRATIGALMKLTVGKNIYDKINIKAMVKQIYESYDENIEKISEWFLTHPYITNRIKEIINFYNKSIP